MKKVTGGRHQVRPPVMPFKDIPAEGDQPVHRPRHHHDQNRPAGTRAATVSPVSFAAAAPVTTPGFAARSPARRTAAAPPTRSLMPPADSCSGTNSVIGLCRAVDSLEMFDRRGPAPPHRSTGLAVHVLRGTYSTAKRCAGCRMTAAIAGRYVEALDYSSAEAAAPRKRSSHPGKPVSAARSHIMPYTSCN